jgi:hypothetical protein
MMTVIIMVISNLYVGSATISTEQSTTLALTNNTITKTNKQRINDGGGLAKPFAIGKKAVGDGVCVRGKGSL